MDVAQAKSAGEMAARAAGSSLLTSARCHARARASGRQNIALEETVRVRSNLTKHGLQAHTRSPRRRGIAGTRVHATAKARVRRDHPGRLPTTATIATPRSATQPAHAAPLRRRRRRGRHARAAARGRERRRGRRCGRFRCDVHVAGAASARLRLCFVQMAVRQHQALHQRRQLLRAARTRAAAPRQPQRTLHNALFPAARASRRMPIASQVALPNGCACSSADK